MPGLVTGIKIKAGQEVEKGSTMFILEAMKMENVILAPHHAIIKEIKVALGHAVEKGTPLVEFDV
jgi:biotin carboxyl carrier protein